MKSSLQTIQATKAPATPLDHPLRMDPNDDSGTPVALVELARRAGHLEFLNEVDAEDVLTEFPMGPMPTEQTGASRFVRLRSGGYALVR